MRIFIPGRPQGKGRPRFWNGHAVTPKNTRTYEQMIGTLYKCGKGKLTDKPVSIDIKAYFCVPKSYTKKKKLAIAKGQLHPTSRPDIDNIVKIILDGLNGIAYADDAQVISITAEKIYTFNECDEGVLVSITEVQADEY